MVTLTPEEVERNRELSRERMRRMRERKRGSVTPTVTPGVTPDPVTPTPVTQDVTHPVTPTVELSDILGGPDLPDYRIFMEVRSLFPLAPITRKEAQSFVDCVLVNGYFPTRMAAQALRNAGQMPAFSDWITQGEVRRVA